MRMTLSDLWIQKCYWQRDLNIVLWNLLLNLYWGYTLHELLRANDLIWNEYYVGTIPGYMGLLWWTILAQRLTEDLVNFPYSEIIWNTLTRTPFLHLSVSLPLTVRFDHGLMALLAFAVFPWWNLGKQIYFCPGICLLDNWTDTVPSGDFTLAADPQNPACSEEPLCCFRLLVTHGVPIPFPSLFSICCVLAI